MKIEKEPTLQNIDFKNGNITTESLTLKNITVSLIQKTPPKDNYDYSCHSKITISKDNKVLFMEYDMNGNSERLDSNYDREVMYNLEHTIHHKALIKVGINELTQMILPSSFGVAPSTLQYRKLCVQ